MVMTAGHCKLNVLLNTRKIKRTPIRLLSSLPLSEHEIIAAWPGLREKLNRSATPGVNGWV